jgi:hypothetical protein
MGYTEYKKVQCSVVSTASKDEHDSQCCARARHVITCSSRMCPQTCHGIFSGLPDLYSFHHGPCCTVQWGQADTQVSSAE